MQKAERELFDISLAELTRFIATLLNITNG